MYELRQVDKKFPGVHALKAVDFKVNRGEIVGLVGENGAGKSTLMKVIYGAYRPDGGHISIDGTTVRFQNPRQAMEHGIGMVFQEQSLIVNLTVMENIFLGYVSQFVKYGVIDWTAMAAAARHQLSKVKLDIDPSTITSKLSFAQRQLVELAKVLTLEERVDGDLVILLDEPTSVLAKREVELLFKIVRDLTSRASFIFVSHRMDEVLDLSDRIYVLKDGEVVDVVTHDEADVDAIQHKMVGRDVDKEYYREHRQKPYDASKVMVSFDGVSHGNRYRNVSFDLHAGEVLCLVGTEGSGREAILRTVFGLDTPTAGTVSLKGEKVKTFTAHGGVERAKWRSGQSDIMLLDHPTRGLDIGAKEDVYEMIRDMSDDGVGILLVTDTLEEAIGLSHTIVVLKDGAVQKTFDGSTGEKPSLYDLVHRMI